MHFQRLRDVLIAVRSATQRHPIVQYLYIGSFCLVYLMSSIWSARTLFFFVTIPFALIGLNYTLLRSTLRHPIFLLTAAYFAILTLTSLAAPDVRAGAIGDHLLQSARVLLLIVITVDLIRRDDRFLKTFGLFLSVSAAIGVVITVLAFYSSGAFPGGSIFATRLQGVPGFTVYYNSNVIGAIFAVACVTGASVLPSGRLSRGEFVAVAIATSMLFAAVVLTQSRSALMASIMGIGLAAVLGGRRRQIRALGLGAAVLLVGLWLWTPFFESLVERGAAMRPEVWSHYWQMAQERFWLGYGVSYDIAMVMPDNQNPLSAHNIILSALVRGGVAAALTLFALVLTCLYRSWKAWRETGAVMPFALIAATAVATTVDHEMTATSLGWPWLLFWIPVGMCLGVSVREASPHSQATTPAPIRERSRS